MSKRIKILFVIDSLGGGGAERVLANLVNGMDRKRFEPVICLALGNRIDYRISDDVAICRLAPVHGKYIDKLITCIAGMFSRYCAVRFALRTDLFERRLLEDVFLQIAPYVVGLGHVVKQQQPDIIMSFLFNSSMISSFYCQFFLKSTPLCLSDHNTLSREITRLYPSVALPLTLAVIGRADRYVSVSEGVKSDIINFTGFSEKRIETIWNGVDIKTINNERYKPLALDLPAELHEKKYPIIVTVGRLTAQKSQDVLLRAFQIVLRNIECRLIVVGEGEAYEDLMSLSNELQLCNKVYFLGWRADLFSVVAKCDVFVLSSSYEACPMVLLEAMALGVPIVSTDCPHGPREALSGGEYGVLVPHGDHEAFADAIVNVIGNIDRSRDIALKAHQFVQNFSVERWFLSMNRF